MRFRDLYTSESSSLPDIYPLCIRLFESDAVVEVRWKKFDGINAARIRRGDDIAVPLGCKVHSDCRKRDINRHEIANPQKKVNSSKLQLEQSARVSSGACNSKSDCLFYGTVIDLRGSDYVKTDQFSRTIRTNVGQ